MMDLKCLYMYLNDRIANNSFCKKNDSLSTYLIIFDYGSSDSWTNDICNLMPAGKLYHQWQRELIMEMY